MAATDGKPSFVYVTYIHSSPEKVWEALTDADLTAAVLGAQQCVGLAAGVTLGAPCAPTDRESPTSRAR